MIQILLTTFNSECFLEQQLQSLLQQTYQNFEILIHDGGSTDNTVSIIQSFTKQDYRIRFLGTSTASAKENFNYLLTCADKELIMFCDHDDVWLPQKISRTLSKYMEMEAQYGAKTPILVFTDSCVTAENLNIIAPSIMHYQHQDPSRCAFNQLIQQNMASGNTMLLNRALIKLANPVPQDAVMHDYWVMLVASAFGKIGFLNESTLYYRQHDVNVIGASSYSLLRVLKDLFRERDKFCNRFDQNLRQALAFLKRYEKHLPDSMLQMLKDLSEWNDLSFWKRREILWKYRIFKTGFLRNLEMFLFV